jgi:hypothetical protein
MVYTNDESIVIERHASDVKRWIASDTDVVVGIDADEYDVESVLGVRGSGANGTLEYLVHFKDYPDEFDLWIPVDDLSDKAVMLAESKFPPGEVSIPKPIVRAEAWINELRPKDISKIGMVRETRRGPLLELQLHGSKVSRMVPVSQLPQAVRDMPDVVELLGAMPSSEGGVGVESVL